MACASETEGGASHRTFAKRARTTSLYQSADGAVSEEEKKGSHPRKWSAEEDERLRLSVEKHQGSNWKEVAKEVKSRTHEQCLQRWKKVLAPGLIKGQWTPEEDQLLLSAVAVNEGGKHKNWGTVSNRIPGRTSKQCRERWCQHLDPRIVKSRWTPAEDEILVSMQKQIGNKWAQIARHLDGRTENAAKIRWKILEREMKTKTEQDDQGKGKSTDTYLRGLASQAAGTLLPTSSPERPAAVHGDHGDGESSDDTMGLENEDIEQEQPSSSAVGQSMGATSGGSRQGQDSHIAGRGGWLAEEDERLQEAVREHGERNWRGVARKVRTRNQVQCAQRWKKALRPGLVKGPWSGEEDENLVALMAKGFSGWTELAANTRRTAKQCRERWTHHLDPSLRHGSWTPEENQLLISLEARLGKKWAAIAREIPGRTEHAVKGRFKTLLVERDMDRQACLLTPPMERHPGKGLLTPPMDRQPASPNRMIQQYHRRGRPPEQAMAMNVDLGAQPQYPTTTMMVTALGMATVTTALPPPAMAAPAVATSTNTNINTNTPVVGEKGGGEASRESKESSIARLLSVSSVTTDTSLPDITSGYCGHGRSSATSNSATTCIRSSSISDVSTMAQTQSDDAGKEGNEAKEPRPRVEGNETGAGKSRQLSPRVSDGQTHGVDLLPLVDEVQDNEDNEDNSDLVTVLMDGGFDPSKDGVDAEGEPVTIGREAYGDYALSTDDFILIGHDLDVLPRKPQGPAPPQIAGQDGSVHGPPLDDVGSASSDWVDLLPTSFFDGGVADDEPADPFYF